MENKIRLSQYRNVNSEKQNANVNIDLANDRGILREGDFSEVINAYNVYLDEREACNKIRLTAQVNLVATNVLFNRITEVVKNEDSDKCVWLNYERGTVSTTFGKPAEYEWGVTTSEFARDTQLTSEFDEKKNYTYHCGLDIFNNHILRSKTQIPSVIPYESSDGDTIDNNFNTISDFLRDVHGKKPLDEADDDSRYMHIYNKSNILTFSDAISQRLQEKDGWLGFINRSKLPSYDKYGVNLGINRVINNVQENAFIDMYPGREYYTMVPYHNRARGRYERNWDFCVTYPYSSTVEGIPCINASIRSLKISHIDENTISDDGIRKTIIYSSCKHNLMANDTVRIFRSPETDDSVYEVVGEDSIVDEIIDDYTFALYLPDNICRRWISENIVQNIESEGGAFIYYDIYDNIYEYEAVGYQTGTSFSGITSSVNGYINADFDEYDRIGSQNLSYVKVENGEQCDYYVRIFSRIPNFSEYVGDLNEESIYKKGSNGMSPIEEYSDIQYGNEATITKLGFSKNIYGDDLVQIVYDDDISIDMIKDNLGRPVTSIYLSFFKANYGRKEWYNGWSTMDDIEHSHCFGKLTCGLRLSPHAIPYKFSYGNINLMNNIDWSCRGLNQELLRGEVDDTDEDEILYRQQNYFYGDLCEYSPSVLSERVIQPVLHRINTQQREVCNQLKMQPVMYDEIKYDDDSNHAFLVTGLPYDQDPVSKKEGYYYETHYEIPIRTLSSVHEFVPDAKKIALIQKMTSSYDYFIKTGKETYFNLDTDTFLYDTANHISYKCKIINILAPNAIGADIYDGNGEKTTLPEVDADNYTIYQREVEIPSYATVATDGSGVYRWRDVMQNGFEETGGIMEEYPFTNGCLYVNRQITLFMRRQDPFGIFGLADDSEIGILNGRPSAIEHEDFADLETYDKDAADYIIKERDSKC